MYRTSAIRVIPFYAFILYFLLTNKGMQMIVVSSEKNAFQKANLWNVEVSSGKKRYLRRLAYGGYIALKSYNKGRADSPDYKKIYQDLMPGEILDIYQTFISDSCSQLFVFPQLFKRNSRGKDFILDPSQDAPLQDLAKGLLFILSFYAGASKSRTFPDTNLPAILNSSISPCAVCCAPIKEILSKIPNQTLEILRTPLFYFGKENFKHKLPLLSMIEGKNTFHPYAGFRGIFSSTQEGIIAILKLREAVAAVQTEGKLNQITLNQGDIIFLNERLTHEFFVCSRARHIKLEVPKKEVLTSVTLPSNRITLGERNDKGAHLRSKKVSLGNNVLYFDR